MGGDSGGTVTIIFSYPVTFWLGLFALGGLSLVLSRVPEGYALPATALLAPAGWLLMLIPPLYLAATAVRRTPLRIRSFELPLPAPQIAVAQLLLSVIDWALAGAVLYMLLPASTLSFLTFLGMFLVAILLGMISHVPGGVGVFEGLMVLLLKPYLPSMRSSSAGRVSRGVLPAAFVDRARRLDRCRNVAASSPRWPNSRRRWPTHRPGDAEPAGRFHVPGGDSAPVLRSHTCGAGRLERLKRFCRLASSSYRILPAVSSVPRSDPVSGPGQKA